MKRLVLLALLAAVVLVPRHAPAQTINFEALVDRMDRIERDMRALSRNVYRGSPGGEVPQSHAFVSGADDLPIRVEELERQVRQLSKIVDQQSRLLQQLERQLASRGGGVPRNEARVEEPADIPRAQPRPEPQPMAQADQGSGPGSTMRNLGDVPVEDVREIQNRGEEAVTAAKTRTRVLEPEVGETPQLLFDRSRQLLLRQDTVSAEAGFNRFLLTYPDHELASSARYWLGETYYVRKDYATAAKIFLESYKRDPKGDKAPNALLKLGMSLSALGSTKEACTTYHKLVQDYPKLRANMKNIAKREQERIGCR